jgi:hypothetical protein
MDFDFLEKDMESAIARCPDLFIESGLKFVAKQVYIDGKRPDLLFRDVLHRDLLVEVQRDRLDENHVQRHAYYYFNYRKKYPQTHPRLMFLANRIVPQHKEFFDFCGYEYKEIPVVEFRRKMVECTGEALAVAVAARETPGVLPRSYQELLYEIQRQPMTLCYKMLLVIEMVDRADSNGRVPIDVLAQSFSTFFRRRADEGKPEENPNRSHGSLSLRSLSYWAATIREQPVRRLGERFLIDEGKTIRWAPEIWTQWSPDLRADIRDTAQKRLIHYFERYAGGW